MGEIENIILRILESKSIDEKTKFGKQAVELFKRFNSENDIPIAIQLNLSLRLRDAIDNFVIQDNLTSRETLESFLVSTDLYLEEAS